MEALNSVTLSDLNPGSTLKRASFVELLGVNERKTGKVFIMSVPNPKESEKNSLTNSAPSSQESGGEEKMTRAQALAVAWTGLEVLALDKEMRILNDSKSGELVLVISGAKVIVEPSDGGKKRLKLVDLKTANTLEPAA